MGSCPIRQDRKCRKYLCEWWTMFRNENGKDTYRCAVVTIAKNIGSLADVLYAEVIDVRVK